MNWSTGMAWWSALKRRRQLGLGREPDPADMGTAFGLDASLGAIDEVLPEAPGASDAASPQPWEHRLTRRSSL